MTSSTVTESINKSLKSSTADFSPKDVHETDIESDAIFLDEHFSGNAKVFHNPAVSVLYEHALQFEHGSAITSSGALATRSGVKTGRSPKDKRIVHEPSSCNDIWWGPVNIPLDDLSFMINRERAIDYLNTQERIYVIDGYAGWDPRYRIKVRVICARAYHALFMHNMLIRITSKEELRNFGEPDYTIYNAGQFPANRFTKGMSSSSSVAIDFARKEMVILGTQYAGEMKKGILTIMMYLMPKMGVLPLHSSCNQGRDNGDTTLFFGLSGTGKTTLSADVHRELIGDDEHVWTDTGCFNIEGGCYAKCIDLSREKEPEIFDAIRFGSVLENVVFNNVTRKVDYNDTSVTENTRCAYPLEHIPNAKFPAIAGHPKNIIMLTCDAFGILPPVSRLTPEQVMYHFIQGYTAKVAGTEVGVTEPTAAFSSCYGEPFIVWHPTKYAEMLAEQLHRHKARAWLINTGWTGGSYGVGSRIKLSYTRAIIDAIHSGELEKQETTPMDVFGLLVPNSCPNVPSEILMPINSWSDKEKYKTTLHKLAKLFIENFKKYQDKASKEVLAAGPQLN
ncbi:hypothetical protein DICPUDRAFT_47664 [Dictyostelium purpureum]|uniref:Phosphoenolpyruvate carboxykinase (ATP) n=1 Tax=Dictyostelium purpureum TaxID=5786 RepID=F0ZKM4_DICPU|nr:uncharacterized protein DICPUDRAFT_47664 [Dictyostelium purpureum]EGC35503.1 hypothetical protein DICPUDRAFT_47664 [Dictyostelium purpureum]|eukprot:XP_003287982.1 hypothetical protein DICPUDRAFT_47664 [Dictyostelium purpureum]